MFQVIVWKDIKPQIEGNLIGQIRELIFQHGIFEVSIDTQLLTTVNNFPTRHIVISAHFGLKYSTKLEESASLSPAEDAYLHSLIVLSVDPCHFSNWLSGSQKRS
jgi:hypothetical protein